MLIDIACLVFVCVTMNHLGLIEAIEGVIKRPIPILNCPKCSSYWSVFIYTLLSSYDIIPSLAISFLASYIAMWVELFEALVDLMYMWVYDKIYANKADYEITASATSSDN